MVCASETFGASPDFVASLITASTSDFHHSPTNWVINIKKKLIKCHVIIKPNKQNTRIKELNIYML